MPTNRPRHMITESDGLANALEAARDVWPEIADDKGALLRRILDEGIDQVLRQRDREASIRQTSIDATAGSLTGVWPAGWREELRNEWPA